MCPLIFDDCHRDITGGADRLVEQFVYLNRSNRDEAERVRILIEDLFSRYPADKAQSLRKRLRSNNNDQHISAFFELVLHELLLRAGCEILAIEPQLEHTKKSPDFLVQTKAGERFYLEATLATGRSGKQRGADRLLAEAMEAINSVGSPDFLLHVKPSGTPSKSVSCKRLKQRLKAWIETLDYVKISAQSNEEATAPQIFHYEEHGVRFAITATPRHRTRGTTTRRPTIASHCSPVEEINPQKSIRQAVQDKAGRYGDLDAPYIIAVNALSEENDALEALFGTEIVQERRTAEGFARCNVNNKDGVWFGPKGPKNTRVSGVLFIERLVPWSLGQRRAQLFMNPWAQKPLKASPLDIDVWEIRDQGPHETDGSSIAELLKLPEGWPE